MHFIQPSPRVTTPAPRFHLFYCLINRQCPHSSLHPIFHEPNSPIHSIPIQSSPVQSSPVRRIQSFVGRSVQLWISFSTLALVQPSCAFKHVHLVRQLIQPTFPPSNHLSNPPFTPCRLPLPGSCCKLASLSVVAYVTWTRPTSCWPLPSSTASSPLRRPRSWNLCRLI